MANINPSNDLLDNIITTIIQGKHMLSLQYLEMTERQTFKFIFTAEIGQFNLNANISSPLTVTWKRSSETASTVPVEMVNGKASIAQSIKLPVNMYFDQGKKEFEEKKSMLSFTMNTPKGQKQAGVVYVDLAKMLNEKMATLADDFLLEKCPVKDSKVSMKITTECLGLKTEDEASIGSNYLNSDNGLTSSSLGFITGDFSNGFKVSPNKQAVPPANLTVKNDDKDRIINDLQSQVKNLTAAKQKLQKEVKTLKDSLSAGADSPDVSSLKEELLKSKSIQKKLQNEVNNMRSESIEHQRQLQKMRLKMQQAYDLLCSNLTNLL